MPSPPPPPPPPPLPFRRLPRFHRDCSLLIGGLSGAVSPVSTLKWELDPLPDYCVSRATIDVGDDACERHLALFRYEPRCDESWGMFRELSLMPRLPT